MSLLPKSKVDVKVEELLATSMTQQECLSELLEWAGQERIGVNAAVLSIRRIKSAKRANGVSA